MNTQGTQSSKVSPKRAAKLIDKYKEEILQTWKSHARSYLEAARKEHDLSLEDHLPSLLSALSKTLANSTISATTGPDDQHASSQHGLQRAQSESYSLPEMLTEYQVLRQSIFDILFCQGDLANECHRIINAFLDRAINQSTQSFIDRINQRGADSEARLVQKENEMYHARIKDRAAIEERDRQFRLLTDLSNQIIFTLTADGQVEYCNKEFYVFTGLQEQKVLDLNWASVFHPDDLSKIEEAWVQAQRQGSPLIESDYRLRRADGQFIWFSFKIAPVEDQQRKTRRWVGRAINVHTQKQALKRLKRVIKDTEREQERIESLILQAPFPICLLTGPQHHFTLANPCYQKFLLGDRDYLGRSVLEVLPECQGLRFIELLDKAYTEGETQFATETPLEFKQADGSIRELRFNFIYQPVRDQDNKVYGVMAAASDVTEQVEARKVIQESESRFRSMAEAMPQIVWTAEPNGILDYYNQRWFDYTGLTIEESKTVGWKPILHPDDHDRTFEAWRESYTTGSVYEIEYRIRHGSSGAYRWHLVRAIPLHDENGRIRKWLGTTTDIHDQKRAHDLIQKNNDEFQLIAETIPQAIWRTNPDGSADYFSQQFAAYVGYEAEEFLGWGWTDPIHPGDKPGLLDEWQRCRDEGQPVSYEFRLQGRDQIYRWFITEGNPFRNEKGEVVKYYGTWTNIDDQKKASEKLIAATKAAEAANESKSTFLANMSHEIRTPLGAIMGFVDLIKNSDLSKQDLNEYVSIIERNSVQLLRIIDDILDLSKVEAGKMLIEHIEFSLVELLSDICALMGFRAQDKGVSFQIKAASVFPDIIQSDPGRIRQILVNVIGNAVKFTERGFVQLELRYSEPVLEFTVTDTGIGIQPKQREKLFHPFHQADTSTTRRFGGTGLGLILTRRLSEALGGSFDLKESTPGQGSTFVSKIKVGITAHTKMLKSIDIPSGAPATASRPIHVEQLQNLKVLVVEDSPDNQNLLNRLLKKAGAQPQIAKNGSEGVELALTDSHDVVLMDIQMPKMDGHQATRTLRQKGYTTPIIALTAHAMKEERQRCLESGFTDFLSKPVERESLISLISRYGR